MKRAFPHAEDYAATAGGDSSSLRAAMGRPLSISMMNTPPGNDGVMAGRNAVTAAELEPNDDLDGLLGEDGEYDTPEAAPTVDFLRFVREAEDQAQLYMAQVNRKAWSQTNRAFHNEHFAGSKYTKKEWRGRSRLFVPKTRAAVRKDGAAVSASLFNSIDAINCEPGNESDPRQKASAAVMQEIVNYRTGGRASHKASLPWFLVSLGARQDAVLTGVCISKQHWLQEHRKTGTEKVLEPDENGTYVEKTRDVYTLELDRPDITLIPPENIVIHSGADWRNPAQSAAFFIVKWPMLPEEIKAKQDAPVNPWNAVDPAVLRSAAESNSFDSSAVRRSREQGIDRLDMTQTGTKFQIIWVYEVFMRIDGEDYTFYSIGDKAYLTDPKPVREVYPEQFGERPIAFGYGSLESHRIFPMSPAESWQPLQIETNEVRNLMLDATKQNVMPITKVRRGRQIDLDQVKRRSSGSAIIVQDPDDVTWEQSPGFPATSVEMQRELGLEFDDLAGQQNYGTVESNNALGRTLGGLKLAAGAANAVQEFEIRIWIETWASPALNQVVRLEQYYEEDPIVLGLAGERAQLFKKYGIDTINDDLLEQDVTVRVSVGLGAGDPQQRLAKFDMAAKIVAPILQQAPEFQSGQREVDIENIIAEVFGAVGYKDGGKRFFKDNGQPRANPNADLQTRALQAKIEKDERTGKAAMFTGLSALAKVALGKRDLEASVVDRLLGRQVEAQGMGFDHGHRHIDQHLSAIDHGHRHGIEIANHRRDGQQMERSNSLEDEDRALQAANGGDAGMGGAGGSASPAPSSAAPSGPPSASPPPQGAGMPGPGPGGPQPGVNDALMQLLTSGKLTFTRDKDGRIAGVEMAKPQGAGGAGPYPMPNETAVVRTRELAGR